MHAIDPVLVRDVVIVIPGIMGSALADANGTPLWSLGPRGITHALTTLGGSLRRLQLPANQNDDGPPDGVRATGLLPSLHVIPGLWSPITGYDGTMNFLRSARFQLIEADPRDADRIPNLLTFPYDWRLSNRYNARLLKLVAEDALARWRGQPGMEDAKLVLLCHSMGGLVARWFLEQEEGAAITRTLITIGTPFRGAARALDTLSNGLTPGIGPFHLRLTEFARSLPSLHQLLPTYNCLTLPDASRVSLQNRDIPDIARRLQDDAWQFHATLDARPTPSYALHKVVGIRQPTLTTASLQRGVIVASEEIDGRSQGGDGTVPVMAAEPLADHGREVHEVAEQHGELQGTRSALDLIDGILSREDIIWQDVRAESFGVSMAELWSPRDQAVLQVFESNNRRLHVTVLDEWGAERARVTVPPDGRVTLDALPPGGYRARVSSAVRGGPAPVTRPFLVWDEAAMATTNGSAVS